jgi:hypothetical protein
MGLRTCRISAISSEKIAIPRDRRDSPVLTVRKLLALAEEYNPIDESKDCCMSSSAGLRHGYLMFSYLYIGPRCLSKFIAFGSYFCPLQTWHFMFSSTHWRTSKKKSQRSPFPTDSTTRYESTDRGSPLYSCCWNYQVLKNLVALTIASTSLRSLI